MNRPSRLAGGGRYVLPAAEVLGSLQQADASPIARPFAIVALFLSFVPNLPIYDCKVWLALPIKRHKDGHDGKRNSAASIGLF
jgi:hypothetical protein